MPRTKRVSVGGLCYHVINRGNGAAQVFFTPGDYSAFVNLFADASERLPMRILAWCVMPTHFHMALQPYGDDDLGRWMHWLATTHVTRYHRAHGTAGHLWQGRFKSFPIQHDAHLLAVLRYIERNPLRAGLVSRADEWHSSSLSPDAPDLLSPSPVPRPHNWLSRVNAAETAAELDDLRLSVTRDRPYGDPDWVQATAKHLGLEATLKPRGRPYKKTQ